MLIMYNSINKPYNELNVYKQYQTFDIPFFCASALLGLTLCQLLPYLVGKDHFSCESGTEAWIGASRLPHANWSCFAQGSVIYVSIITIYTYFMVLSFCIWRYLHRPLKPLYGIHKKWWHLAIWTYILGMKYAILYFHFSFITPSDQRWINI